MIRRFGSAAAFDRVKRSQNLIGRGNEVGLSADTGYTQDALTARRQSCTINSHRLVLYVTEKFGVQQAELLYEELNARHFLRSGVLNDPILLLSSALTILGEEHREDISGFLASDEKYDDVKRILSELSMIGIHGIPTLVAAGSLDHVTSGAARAEELAKFLEEVVRDVNSGSVLPERLFGTGKLAQA